MINISWQSFIIYLLNPVDWYYVIPQSIEPETNPDDLAGTRPRGPEGARPRWDERFWTVEIHHIICSVLYFIV